jgi:hypothetical protein
MWRTRLDVQSRSRHHQQFTRNPRRLRQQPTIQVAGRGFDRIVRRARSQKPLCIAVLLIANIDRLSSACAEIYSKLVDVSKDLCSEAQLPPKWGT